MRIGFVVAFLLLSGAGDAYGQRVAGTVTDRETGTGVGSALVQLIGADSAVLASVFSDSAGRFAVGSAVSVPADGFVYVARLGYRALRAALRDLPRDLSGLSISLERDPVRLGEIDVAVAARNRNLAQAGFYDRQRLGFGRFITRDMLDDRYHTANRITEVIAQVPGVFRVQESFDQASVFMRAPFMRIDTSSACPAVVYIDGIFQPDRTFRQISKHEVEAVEIYRSPSEVPAHYGGAEAACGVILIWLRTGGEEAT